MSKNEMKEANGTYKKTTKYVSQLKNVNRRFYRDNFKSTDLSEVKEWVDRGRDENLKWRIIKRTVKEEIIQGPESAQNDNK